MNAVLFAVGWLLIIFAGIPTVLAIIGGQGQDIWIGLLVAIIGMVMLGVRSRRRAKEADDGTLDGGRN